MKNTKKKRDVLSSTPRSLSFLSHKQNRQSAESSAVNRFSKACDPRWDTTEAMGKEERKKKDFLWKHESWYKDERVDGELQIFRNEYRASRKECSLFLYPSRLLRLLIFLRFGCACMEMVCML